MSGILAVYALVISVLIASDIKPPPEKEYSLFAGFMHMGAGLSVGLSGLAAGYAIGIVGDAVRTKVETRREQSLTGTGCTLFYAPVEDLRWHGPHPHFRRSPGSLRVYSASHQDCAIANTNVYRLIVALIMNTRASG